MAIPIIFHTAECGLLCKPPVAVSIDILLFPLSVNVVTVVYIKPPVIMFRIIDAVFSRPSVMPCQLHASLPLSFKMQFSGFFLMAENQKMNFEHPTAPDNTQYELTQASPNYPSLFLLIVVFLYPIFFSPDFQYRQNRIYHIIFTIIER